METQSGFIEVDWGEESVEGNSAVVPAVQVDEGLAVQHEDSRARTSCCMRAGREDIRKSTPCLSLLSSPRVIFHISR